MGRTKLQAFVYKFIDSNEYRKVLYMAQLERNSSDITIIVLDLYSLGLGNLTRTFPFKGIRKIRREGLFYVDICWLTKTS